jgi:hypothetical protein
MKWRVISVVTMGCFIAFSAAAGDRTEAVKAIDGVLTGFHQAASDADGDLYFSLLAEDAILLGTDATERWSVEEFEAFAKPYFSEGRGWTYESRERHIAIAQEGKTAWFDEILWNDNYGTCRGTGVLIHTENGWRITQYNLSIPIPNDLARDFTNQIKDFEADKDR